MRRLPRYYCPAGVPAPAHQPHLGGLHVIAGHGPDVADGGPGGGMVYGGAYTTGEAGWARADAGWWVNLDGVQPQVLVRMQADPRIVTWDNVQGGKVGDWWRVPVLLSPEGRDEDGNALLFVSALNDSWNGSTWEADPELAAIQRRLLNVAHGIATAGSLDDGNRELVELVVDILAIGHAVTVAEVIAGRWMTRALYIRVLLTATGMVIPEAGTNG